MLAAAIILGFAALGGITIASMRIAGMQRPPTWIALGHGAFAATGIGFLIAAAIDPGVPQLAFVALGAFVLAALGGVFIFVGYHLKKRPLPIPLVIGHGLAALLGYILLLTSLFGSP